MVIALLTDFGTRDYFVGAMRGVILSINESAQIVDITHEIPPQDIVSAGFTLRACYKDFPRKTIFVAVVDPGVGSARRAILVETDDHYFIAPDNGLLSFIFEETADYRVFEITNENFLAEKISATFHGRDIFAPSAAHLSNGVKSSEFGSEIVEFVRSEERLPPKISENIIESEIIQIDHFGNLITNLKSDDLPQTFFVKLGNARIDKLQKFYSEAEKNEIFMIFGSTGSLEIVAFQDSAEKLLDAERGQKITVYSLNC